MSASEELIALYKQRAGKEISIGDWLQIDQDRINAFAQATGDLQWIHIDPERAVVDSPYKSTVAHGFLTLSLLPLLTRSNAAGGADSWNKPNALAILSRAASLSWVAILTAPDFVLTSLMEAAASRDNSWLGVATTSS